MNQMNPIPEAPTRERRALNRFFQQCINDGMDGQLMAQAMLDVLAEGGHLDEEEREPVDTSVMRALDRIDLLVSATPTMTEGQAGRALAEVGQLCTAIRSTLCT